MRKIFNYKISEEEMEELINLMTITEDDDNSSDNK